MASWDAYDETVDEIEEEDSETGAEFYTIVLHYPKLSPKHFIPQHAVYDGKGQKVMSQYGKDTPRTEDGSPDTVKRRKVEKWATKGPTLSAMAPYARSICNGLKAFFAKSQTAVFYHNANVDECSQFGGPHLHCLIRSEQTASGKFRKLWQITTYKTLVKRISENGGYMKSQAVRSLEDLLVYLIHPPRLYMGTNCKTLSTAYGRALEAISIQGIKPKPYVELVDTEEDPTASATGTTSTDFDGFDDDVKPQKRKSEWSDDEPEVVLQPPTKKVSVGYSGADQLLSLTKRLALYFDAFSVSDMYKVIGLATDFGKEGEYKKLWKRLAPKPKIRQYFETIRQELEASYIHKPFMELINDYCTWNKFNAKEEEFETPEKSYQIMCEWATDQKIDLCEWVQIVFEWMDRKSDKQNTMCIIGPKNSGKTIMIQQPLSSICRFVGKLGNRAANGDFVFQDCPNKRLISIDECVLAREQMEDMKLLLGGEEFRVNVKYQGLTPVLKTPVIITGNYDPWHLEHLAKEPLLARCFYYQVREIPELANVKRPSPKMWWYLAQLRDMTSVPDLDDLVALPEPEETEPLN
uniref:Nonstructural protein n=1 Tax=Parvoviridae sp. TaxID=1940570 RepID=A0A7D3UD78_9VIRU|nr:MAG: nonstructural protein [Parvoviridae sp.]